MVGTVVDSVVDSEVDSVVLSVVVEVLSDVDSDRTSKVVSGTTSIASVVVLVSFELARYAPESNLRAGMIEFSSSVIGLLVVVDLVWNLPGRPLRRAGEAVISSVIIEALGVFLMLPLRGYIDGTSNFFSSNLGLVASTEFDSTFSGVVELVVSFSENCGTLEEVSSVVLERLVASEVGSSLSVVTLRENPEKTFRGRIDVVSSDTTGAEVVEEVDSSVVLEGRVASEVGSTFSVVTLRENPEKIFRGRNDVVSSDTAGAEVVEEIDSSES